MGLPSYRIFGKEIKMLVYKCDRCGKIFTPDKSRVKKIKIGSFPVGEHMGQPLDVKEYDLCTSCFKEFNYIWMGFEEDQNERE